MRKVHEFKDARVAYTRELLRRHPEVRVGDIDIAARIVVSAIEQVVHQIIADNEPIDLKGLEDEMVAMFTRYLAPGAS